jgi:Domain of unknown function (DUF4124)
MTGVQMRFLNFILVLTVLSMSPLVSHAQVYKWKDKDGTIKYTDTPPPSNVKQETIGSKNAAQPTGKEPLSPVDNSKKDASSAKKPAEAVDTQDAAAKLRQRNAEAEKNNKQEKEAEAKRKAENCKVAKANFETYKQGGRISIMSEKGERQYLDDKAIDAGKAEAQKQVSEYCS